MVLRELAHEAETREVESGRAWQHLEAASAWATDRDGACAHRGEVPPDLSLEAWRFIARLRRAALVVEGGQQVTPPL